jgi:hypothetical protein
MGKPSAHRQSALAISKGARDLKKLTNATWKLAPKAPMFTRKSKNQQGKKKTTRTVRLIGGHAYKIAASGAAGFAAAVMQREAAAFRATIGTESKRTPWLPSVSPGAMALLEQWLCAYAQTATRHAVNVRTGLGSTDKQGQFQPLLKRLNGRLMKIGFDTADEQVFQPAMPAPRKLIVCKPEPKKTKKARADPADPEDEADYQPPEAD